MKNIILVLTLLLLTGCYDYVEVDDLAMATGIVIDYNAEEKKYLLTTQVIVSEETNNVKVYKTEGTSVERALLEISKMSNKEVYISHLKVIFLTDSIIKNNINYYDYLLRNAKSKMNYYVYYVDEKTKDKILTTEISEDGSALYIENMLRFNINDFSTSNSLPFINLMHDNLEYGINIVYPSLIIEENENKKIIKLSNLVSYNYKYDKIYLNQNESVTYNIIKNNIKKTELDIKCEGNMFSIDINENSTSYKWENDILYIDNNITAILKNYDCTYDKSDNDTNKELTKIAKKYIKDEIEKLVNIAKEKENDFLGIGNYIYKKDKHFYDFDDKEWDPYLKNVDVKVTNKLKIIASGETRKGKEIWRK